MSRHGLSLAQALPGELPRGERVLWCGGPDGAALARYALHLRKLAVYFVLLLAWRLLAVWRDGAGADAAVSAAVTTTLLAACVLGAAWLYARYSARTTQYTITDQRIVIRTGIALSIAVNLPFAKVASADVRRRADGGGDIVLTLAEDARVGYVILWPSVKPLHFARPLPMLRALRNVDPVAEVLGTALARHAAVAGAADTTRTAPHGALAAG